MFIRMQEWQPKFFLRYEGCANTSTGVARIVTDAGKAYIKALGNAEGPHALAREWVGTRLAEMFGLPTFQYSILTVEHDDEIILGHGKRAIPGPAFVTRAAKGHSWGGSEKELQKIDNREDISRLIVFDTFIRNRDRHPPNTMTRKPNPDNVFLCSEGSRPDQYTLLAIDHTHCFSQSAELCVNLNDIDVVRDAAVYGLFPAFLPFVTMSNVEQGIEQLRQLDKGQMSAIINSLPAEWEVSASVRGAWLKFLVGRAEYLVDTLLNRIKADCWPGRLFDDGPNEATP